MTPARQTKGSKLNGTPREREAWVGRLRDRFAAIARRRVSEEAVEDVVQDALRVVIEKGLSGQAGGPEPADPADAADPADPAGASGSLPDLRWCFQVLRHTIGNHYQKQQVRRRELAPEDVPLSPAAPTPLEALERRESARLVRESVEALSAIDSNCGRYMTHILEGRTPSEIAEEERLAPAVLYRRVYRCRGKLRSLLLERGVFA